MNLTGADTVIFYDSDWNPAMDAQVKSSLMPEMKLQHSLLLHARTNHWSTACCVQQIQQLQHSILFHARINCCNTANCSKSCACSVPFVSFTL